MTSKKKKKADPNKAATGATVEGRSPNYLFQWLLHIQEAGKWALAAVIPRSEALIKMAPLLSLLLANLGAEEWTGKNQIKKTSYFCDLAGQQQ